VYSRVEPWRTLASIVAAAVPACGFRAAIDIHRSNVALMAGFAPAIDVRAISNGRFGGEIIDSLRPYGFDAAVADLTDRIRKVE